MNKTELAQIIWAQYTDGHAWEEVFDEVVGTPYADFLGEAIYESVSKLTKVELLALVARLEAITGKKINPDGEEVNKE